MLKDINMSKYGRFELGAPDYTQEVAAVKDLFEKGEIDRSEYRKKLSELQRERLTYIVATNGGHTPSRKTIKQFDMLKENLTAMKERHNAQRLLQNRDQFLEALKQPAETEQLSKRLQQRKRLSRKIHS